MVFEGYGELLTSCRPDFTLRTFVFEQGSISMHISEITTEHRNRGCNFGSVWNACQSQIFRVVDEEGNNVANAQVRHLLGQFWLYVDDTDGYLILLEGTMDYLMLEAEKE